MELYEKFRKVLEIAFVRGCYSEAGVEPVELFKKIGFTGHFKEFDIFFTRKEMIKILSMIENENKI